MWKLELLPLVFAAMSITLLTGCRRDMQDQPRYKPFAKSRFFADGRSARPQVAGTIADGDLREDNALYEGVRDGRFLDTLPFPVTRDVLARGQERYDIYCAPCHGATGYGDGMIAQRGFRAPPSLHSARSRALPTGYVFSVITNGYGAMPDYSEQISTQDRWAVAAYVRALQFSRNAQVSDVPTEDRAQLDAQGGR